MARFELSQAAASDLAALAEYTIERWGNEQARHYIEALQARLTQLAHQPRLGRARDELAPRLLSVPFESHVIFSMETEFGIVVVRILHDRQDPFRHLD